MITCRFENGDQTSLRHLCAQVIVVKKNQVLLGKRGTSKGRKILEFGKWGLLGGFMQRDETLEEGVRREVREESGWQIGSLKLFRINDNPDRPAEDRQNVDVIFLAEVVKKTGTGDEEVTDLKWFDINHLPPKEGIAFDFSEHLELYQRYLQKKFPLPLLGRVDLK